MSYILLRVSLFRNSLDLGSHDQKRPNVSATHCADAYLGFPAVHLAQTLDLDIKDCRNVIHVGCRIKLQSQSKGELRS